MTPTDSCPRCCRRGIQPTASRRRGDQVVHVYRCPCGHAWATSRLIGTYAARPLRAVPDAA